MDEKELCKVLVSACKQYHDILAQKTYGGMVVTEVLEVRETEIPTKFQLMLRQRLRSPIMCVIFINHAYCKDIEITAYKAIRGFGKSYVNITVPPENIAFFRQCKPWQIEVVSDLKFLIRALSAYYKTHELNLYPPAPLSVPELPEALVKGMSEEQKTACNGVFESPVSYVWGAPGTGKTRMVLSRAILRYVLDKKRVLLLAPTNNAIEQVLRGVLPVLKEANIPLSTAYRFGMASSEFASEYPQVVGDKQIEEQLLALQGELKGIDEVVASAQDDVKKLQKAEVYQRSLKEDIVLLQPKIDRLSNCRQVLQEAESAYEKLNGDFQEIENRCEEASYQATTYHGQHLSELLTDLQTVLAKKEENEAVVTQFQEQYEKTKERHIFAIAEQGRLSQKVCLLRENVEGVQRRINQIRFFFWKGEERQRLQAEMIPAETDLRKNMEELAAVEATIPVLAAELDAQFQQYQNAVNTIRSCAVQQASLTRQIKSRASKCPAFEKINHSLKAEEIADALDAVYLICEEAQEELSRLEMAKQQVSKAFERKNAAARNRDAAVSEIVHFHTELPGLSKICTMAGTHTKDEFQTRITSISRLFAEEVNFCRNKVEGVAVKIARKKEILIEINKLAGNTKLKQMRDALILSGTFDSILSHLPIDPTERQICHIFIDEAGYTSIARGMVAFTLNCPVSFFGDHKQLPPVCEVNRIPESEQEISLFALSATLYPMIVQHDMNTLYRRCYCYSETPCCSSDMPMHTLNYTYRFGEPLAKLLAARFYSPDFHGIADAEFSVEILDAPKSASDIPRTSWNEVAEIGKYLRASDEKDISILTPYTKQVKLLQENLPSLWHDNILTVHRSQGREWNTVILSVTDEKQAFLVDSTIPQGSMVLNTAISRAKNKLVVVCDVAYWRKQEGQLICDLIEMGKLV